MWVSVLVCVSVCGSVRECVDGRGWEMGEIESSRKEQQSAGISRVEI